MAFAFGGIRDGSMPGLASLPRLVSETGPYEDVYTGTNDCCTSPEEVR